MSTPSFQNQNASTSRNKAGSPASDDTEQRRFTDLGNATIFFTMAVPTSSRAVSDVVSASASSSSFPRRQSSMVNTFKQLQRINLIRMMFHEPPAYHQISHRAQMSRSPSGVSDSYQESCYQRMGDSSELNQSQVSAAYKTPSLRIRLKSGNFNKQRHSRSLSPTSGSQSSQRMSIDANLQYKTSMDHLECSTLDNDTNRVAKKQGHIVTLYCCQSPLEKDNNKTAGRYLPTGQDLVKSIKLHKKEQEKHKLMRERLDYYKRTRHILNYYINEDRELEDPEPTQQNDTPLVECFLTSPGRRPLSSRIDTSSRARSCSHR